MRVSTLYREFFVVLLLVAGTLTVFRGVVDHAFLNYDDDVYVLKNEHVRTGLTYANVTWALTADYRATWQPLTWISYQVDVALGGLDPRGFHRTSLLLHVANVLLLFLALRGLTGSVWRSGLVAALFAVHPLQVQPVAWIASRKDVLSALFWMLGLLAYAAYVKRPRATRYALMMVAMVLGLMAKPVVMTFPLVLLLLDFWPTERFQETRKKAKTTARAMWILVREKIPLLALSIASGVATLLVHGRGDTISSLDVVSLSNRLGHVVVAYATYALKTVWPVRLSIYYPYAHEGLPIQRVVGSAALLLIVSLLCVARWRKQPYLLVGWLWFLGVLVPAVGIVQVGGHAMADRFMYLPSIGLSVLAVWGIGAAAARWRLAGKLAPCAGCAAVIALAVVASFQVKDWRDSISVFRHAVAVQDDNVVAHTNLAGALEIAAASQMSGALDEAITHYGKALQLKPFDPRTPYNLGVALQRQGRLDEAGQRYRQTLRLDPDHANAHHNLGVIFALRGELEEALEHHRSALRVEPDHAEAHNSLGLVYAQQGRLALAADHYQASLRSDPNHPDTHVNLGNVFVAQGKPQEAANHYLVALGLDPEYAQAHRALARVLHQSGQIETAIHHYGQAVRLRPEWTEPAINLALLLATTPDERLRRVDQAIALAEQACTRTDPASAVYLDTLGVCYAAGARYRDAIDTAQRAAELARAQGLDGLTAGIERRLALYEQQKPASVESFRRSP